MKKATFDNPNKIHMGTGHKTFDKQTNYIGPGAVIANTQVSNFIRPVHATLERAPGDFAKWGELTKYDLNSFKAYGITAKIEAEIMRLARGTQLILYCFYHTRDGKKTIHGYICTDMNYKLIKTWVLGSWKSDDVIRECKEYVSNRN